MKIGYFADGPWAHKALEKIISSNLFEILYIVPRYDTQDSILKNWASKLKIPFLPISNINSSDSINILKNYSADLMVSMSFNQILKKEIINLSKYGFINCHAGALPFYRGRNPLNWALINDEPFFGITVHFVDEGIDTGDIIEQEHFSIDDTDNYQSILLRAIEECANVLFRALIKIKNNNYEAIAQHSIHPIGSYYGMRKRGDEVLDLRWNARKIFNFIRGISYPGPCARIWLEKEEFAIGCCSLIENAPAYISTIGEIVKKDDNGIIVKVGDGTILLSSIKKVNGDELVDYSNKNFRIGMRFDLRMNRI